jgi:hypothetical protein
MTFRRAHACFEADRFQVRSNMLRSSTTLAGEGWIRRNRRDPQQSEQAVKALVDIAVDTVEDRVECAHEQLRRGKPD